MEYAYFHGYKSSPLSQKAKDMQEILKCNIYAPDFNVSIDKINDLFEEVIKYISCKKDDICIVGSSLGGLYSLYISAKTGCKAILLNPCLFPMLIVSKVDTEVSKKELIQAQMLTLYAFEHYNPCNVKVWVTNDPLIDHKVLTKPFFAGHVDEYVEFSEEKAYNHEFIGFKEIFEEYVKNND